MNQDCCAPAGARGAKTAAATSAQHPGPLVEVLYFDGCPNHEPAIALVQRVAAELGLRPKIRLVHVPDKDAAQALRFLGSPTVRVAGRDIEPGAEERTDFALSYRVFRTDSGFNGEPDERWVREALVRESPRRSTDASEPGMADASRPLADALAAAGIPTARLGKRRGARLSPAEHQLYVWILRRFAAEEPPSAQAIGAEAEELGLDLGHTRERLAADDLVHFDAEGEVAVAYPFSGRPRGHRVLIDGERWVEAMCAIDALGIAPMLGLPIEITSRDPVSGAEVWVRLDPGEGAWWEPEDAVVLAGSTCCEGPSFRGCCDVLNFFESTDNAEQYLREHDQVSGVPISIPEASELGRAVFGDVFKEA